jgi:chromatin remodeling complex protein RSC6
MEEHAMPKKKTNTAFLKMAQAPLKPSPQLAEILGSPAPISRPQVEEGVGLHQKA